MPTYEFRNKKSGKITERVLKMSQKDQFLKDNPHLEAYFATTPDLITGFNKKPDQGFRDLLKTIKKGNSKGFTKSNINTF